jgi:hypothetical protein
MAKTHLTHRFSPEAIAIIVAHQQQLTHDRNSEVDRSEALEDIILSFPKKPLLQGIFRRRRPAPDPLAQSLEVFTHG